MAKKVLWVSYSPLTREQDNKLERFCGTEGEEVSIYILTDFSPIFNWKSIFHLAEDDNFDILAFDAHFFDKHIKKFPKLDDIILCDGKKFIIFDDDNCVELSVKKL